MSLRRSNKYLYVAPGVSNKAIALSDDSLLSGKNIPMNTKNWSTRLGVYDRLFTHHTFNSIRRNYCSDTRNMIPNDSLDFALSSIYVHNEDYNIPKSYIPMQPETLNIQMWNVHQNGYGYDISPGLSKNKTRNKEKKPAGPVIMKVDEPRISIATSLISTEKQMQKLESGFQAVIKKCKKISGHTGLGRKNLHQRHNESFARDKYEKSSLGNRSPLLSGRKYFEKYRKTEASTRPCGEISSGTKYPMKIRNVKTTLDMLKTRHGEIDSGENFTILTRDVKSADIMMTVSHKAPKQETVDGVLDRTQRRETHAVQMRAIERIHPSSLKLAVDGPHSDQTNPGYSRKIDGTFYSI